MLSRATVLAVVAVAAAGCVSQQPVQAPAPATGGFVVMDLDAHGVVLLDLKTRSYVGVSRDRGEMWRAAASAALVSCLSHCPDAALS